jgi:hypothetical protein
MSVHEYLKFTVRYGLLAGACRFAQLDNGALTKRSSVGWVSVVFSQGLRTDLLFMDAYIDFLK